MGRKVVHALKPSTTLQPMEGSLWLIRGGAAPQFFQSVDHCLLSTIMMQTLCWTNIFHAPLGFPCGSSGKESACNVGDLGLIPGLGRYPPKGKGYPLQYSGLENSMDCVVHGVSESDTVEWLSLHSVQKLLIRVGDKVYTHDNLIKIHQTAI